MRIGSVWRLLESTHDLQQGLTPELSRADLRPWASENEQSSHEAAKRARLERIVRPVPAVLLNKEPNGPESSADNRSLRDAEPRNGVPAL